MNKKGFYIKSIIATGKGMKLSRLDFLNGCNLLFGPSDSGKTSVFSIIDFMLGSQHNPKEVLESQGYDTYYMEFVTNEDNKVHTVCRELNSRIFIVKDCLYESFNNEFIKSTSYSLNNKSGNSYSQYLMRINGFASDLEIRKNKYEKTKMSFAWARHLMLISEDRIVSTKPIFNPINDSINQQSEKSFIYYLTTGEDDKNFVNKEKEEIRTSRIGGMILLTEESICEIDNKILELGDVSFADLQNDDFFNTHKKEIQDREVELSIIYSRRKCLEEEVRTIKSKILFTNEFIHRMNMLRKHYLIDLNRYEYIYQGVTLFESITIDSQCPLCHSKIDNQQLDQKYLDAIQREYNIVKTKISDVTKMIEQKQLDLEILNKNLNLTVENLKIIEKEITDFQPRLEFLKETLNRYQKNIERKAYATFLQCELQRLSKKLDELKKEQKNKPVVQNYKRQSSIDEEFCEMLKSKLMNWNVIGDESVIFDEDGFDFKFGAKKRLTCGKGTRGVTCTAIMMTLVEYCCYKEIPFTHLLVVDSPLTAHFDDGKVDAEVTTQTRFFKYCNDTNLNYQLIIIDNKSPISSERKKLDNIHYIEFSENGRKGFYLGKEK